MTSSSDVTVGLFMFFVISFDDFQRFFDVFVEGVRFVGARQEVALRFRGGSVRSEEVVVNKTRYDSTEDGPTPVDLPQQQQHLLFHKCTLSWKNIEQKEQASPSDGPTDLSPQPDRTFAQGSCSTP